MSQIQVDYGLFLSMLQTIEHLVKIREVDEKTANEWLDISTGVLRTATKANDEFVATNHIGDQRDVGGGARISANLTKYI